VTVNLSAVWAPFILLWFIFLTLLYELTKRTNWVSMCSRTMLTNTKHPARASDVTTVRMFPLARALTPSLPDVTLTLVLPR